MKLLYNEVLIKNITRLIIAISAMIASTGIVMGYDQPKPISDSTVKWTIWGCALKGMTAHASSTRYRQFVECESMGVIENQQDPAEVNVVVDNK